MRKLSALAEAVRSLILDSDEHLNQPGDLQNAVTIAVNKFSQFKPRLRIYDITGDGSTFVFATPANWQFGFSRIVRGEYPFDVTSQSRCRDVDPRSVEIYLHDDTTQKIRLFDFIPADSKVLRLLYSVEHTVDEDTSTLHSGSDEDSVVYWAAAICLRTMAAAANAVKDPNFSGATTNLSPRAQSYIQLAELYEKNSGLIDAPALGFAPAHREPRNRLTHRS